MFQTKNTIFERYYDKHLENPHKNIILYPHEAHYTTLTYEDITKGAINLSVHLHSKGIQRYDNIALILENSHVWPIVFLGIIHNNSRCVPLNPALPDEELFTYLTHSEAKCIITSKSHQSRFIDFCNEQKIAIIEIDSKETTDILGQDTAGPGDIDCQEDDIALIAYTSGTTSSPKGVQLSHKNLLANVDSLFQSGIVNDEDCIVALLPFYHSYPLMVTLIAPLLIGAKISFPVSLDFQELIHCIQLTNVSIFPGVPQLFTLLTKMIKDKLSRYWILKRITLRVTLDLSSFLRSRLRINFSRYILKDLHALFGKHLRFMVSGGAPLKPQTAQFLYRLGFTLIQGYGLTETSPVVSFNSLNDTTFSSIGKPLPGVEVKINEPQDGIGEIIIRGNNVTSGYYKNEEATRQALKEGWFYSGDLGYQDKSGSLFITGRKTELIVLSSGKKIIPDELENFYNQSPYIKEICITLTKTGQDKEILTGIIIPDYSEFIHKDISQIQDRIRWEIEKLARSLPPYQRIKKYIITNKELPRTTLGKIKRYEIAHMHIETEGTTEKSLPPQPLSDQDEALLSSPICQKALKYLEDELKRSIHLDDQLELDLGLDSLEQVGLFMGFKKVTGVQPNELEFLTVFTVRDVLQKFNQATPQETNVDTAIDWTTLFQEPLTDTAKRSIRLGFPLFLKMIALGFHFILKCVSCIFFRLEVKGIENLPQHGPYLLCPNHTSFLDGPLVGAALPFTTALETYFVGFAGYFKHPIIRNLSRILRLIPIEANSQLTQSLQMCAYLLKQDKIVCLFPEGGRSITGELKPFKRGAGILIKELMAPVIPVYIQGAHHVWPPFHRFPRPGKVTIVFGVKQNLADLEQNGNVDIDSYQNIVDNLRGALQDLQKDSAKA